MKDDTNSEIITKLMMNKAGILETANITRIAKTRMRVAKSRLRQTGPCEDEPLLFGSDH
jgi:hypothetical protein